MKFEDITNVYDLKYWYYQQDPNGHFFDRKTMAFFGDTMKNFGFAKITGHNDFPAIRIHRRYPVKHNLQGSFTFYESGRITTDCLLCRKAEE